LRVGFTVSNLDESVRALSRLEFERTAQHELVGDALSTLYGLPDANVRVAELELGDETVELTECKTHVGRRIPADSRSNDAWFQHIAVVVRDMDTAYAHVFEDTSAGEPEFRRLSPAPQTIPLSNPAAGGIRALYFRDRDGHDLELLWFPPGKGKPHWQHAEQRLFLGIDHSAIAVADDVQSRVPYDALGFAVAGTSYNFGSEQEALSGVPGARVAITGLSAAGGPGVEFLSYRAPTGGRAAIADTTACDLWHWEITIAVPSVERALKVLEAHGVRRASAGIATFADETLGYRRAVLVRDVDGHTLRLVEA
jgi:catechol 2,3-dioxygenase-like lactoylglutathione lyase family enzyme